MFDKVIWLNGMPRSGTSWLSQIFDSCPEVAFRLSPLFSYEFKNRINKSSSLDEVIDFFKDVYESQNDFLTQREKRENGEYPDFNYKKNNPEYLVIKDSRYHNLTEFLLKTYSDIQFIHIIRNPCAVINSWINTDREFKNKGCEIERDWRSGICRKTGPEEFWGFNDWIYLTKFYLKLEREYPEKVLVIKYEDLVPHSVCETERMLKFSNLEMHSQTIDFLENCHSKHISNEYAVYKSKSVKDKWRKELNKEIILEIYSELEGTRLEQFLV